MESKLFGNMRVQTLCPKYLKSFTFFHAEELCLQKNRTDELMNKSKTLYPCNSVALGLINFVQKTAIKSNSKRRKRQNHHVMYPVIGCRFPSAPPLFSVTPLTEESAPPEPLCQKKITLNYNTHLCLYRHTGIYIFSSWGEKYLYLKLVLC